MPKHYTSLEKTIQRSLSDAGFNFRTDVSSGGIRSDFLVEGTDGRLIVVETKRPSSLPNFWSRLAHQATLYETALGADRVFFVVDTKDAPSDIPAVVRPDEIAAKISAALADPSPPKRLMVVQETEATVFAAMPFAPEYDDVFFVAMSEAAKAVNAKRYRVDKEQFTGDIVTHIKANTEKSIAVIMDLSESKANVMYEAGYAHALRRPTVHICSTPLKDLPFDVAGWNTITYSKGQTAHLREPLTDRLKAVLR